ncbi:Deshydrogenase mokE [Colletotrichum fructicola]|nr:Deshydrogenase mokE [Colletotrichum fructicola]
MQLLRLAGLISIGLCSPKHFDLSRKNGAQDVFDRFDKDVAQKIKAHTRNNLKYALDCISTVESTTVCYNAMGRAGGNYVALEPFPEHAATRAVVTKDFVVGPCIFGEGCTYPAPYGREPDEKMRALGVELWEIAERLVHEGKLNHHPVRILEGGFEGIRKGLELLTHKGSAARLFSYLAPSSEGGFSDWESIVHKYFSNETLRQGRSLDEIVEQVCVAKNGHDAFNGTVISIPGCKEIYDYEREFGEFGMIRTVVSSLLRETVTLVQATDGIICASAMALEGETLTACNKYTAVYPVGVQIGPKNWSRDGLIEDERIRSYLDRHAKDEVLVISFG